MTQSSPPARTPLLLGWGSARLLSARAYVVLRDCGGSHLEGAFLPTVTFSFLYPPPKELVFPQSSSFPSSGHLFLDSAGGDRVPETLPAALSNTGRCHMFFISLLMHTCFEILSISCLLYVWSPVPRPRAFPQPPTPADGRPACSTERWRFSGVSLLGQFRLPEKVMP